MAIQVSLINRASFIAFCLSIACVLTWNAPLSADPLPRSKKKSIAGEHISRGNPCAIHGPGFVQAAGGTTCVKIGGRVRFEIGVGRGKNTFRTR